MVRSLIKPGRKKLPFDVHLSTKFWRTLLLLHLHLRTVRKFGEILVASVTALVHIGHILHQLFQSSFQPRPVRGRRLLLARSARWRLKAPPSFDQEPVLVAQEVRELLEPREDLDVVVADVPSIAELARRKKSDDRDHRVDARHQQRLVPGQVGDGGVARAQVLQVLLAILPTIRGPRRRAARATLFLLRVRLEPRVFNRLADPSQLPRGSDASLRPLFLEDGPLFIADFAIEELLAGEELEVFAQVLEGGRVVELGKGRSFARVSGAAVVRGLLPARRRAGDDSLVLPSSCFVQTALDLIAQLAQRAVRRELSVSPSGPPFSPLRVAFLSMPPRRDEHLEAVISVAEVAGALLLLDLQVARGLGKLLGLQVFLLLRLPPLLRLGVLRPHREVQLLLEFLLPRTLILVVAERVFLDNDPDPTSFLNESDSMLIFGEASAKDLRVGRAGRAELVESARALEGIAFNRAHGATLFALGHSLHLSSLLLLLLEGVVEKPPSFLEAGGLHLVAPKLVATISVVLDGFLRQRCDVGRLLLIILGLRIPSRGERCGPSVLPRHRRVLPEDLPRPDVEAADARRVIPLWI